ncbi:HAD family hydrolase [Candidatus Woesearchaeota archaeon]|jgi:HAD superfamily hydrolase (TIGR01662 family)|nr:HAD family hydrolase [Candidatus Woesearchaeota archaeon]MBT5272412.1 HAD family hydrolase [Candidatus Woesearchaeota archaeon]MBT6041246.1 HAD family hydrolase [Candidatus Woesearchaeota archaeon]MBT6337466.1 HAD family hydrolase [Candidatus Woesearchaeota archaeon]MBT7928221.1 HAD family hydrolase [Candidatus Woesearchaeota archaeon]
MAKTKLIIFDYDGVLIDTFTVTCQIYNKLFSDLDKKEFSEEEFKDFFDIDWFKSLAKIGLKTEENIQKCKELYSYYMHKHNSQVKPCTEIPELLHELKKQGYKIAIVSNNINENIIPKLENENLHEFFDLIVDAKDGLKPNPDGINVVLSKLGIKPDEAILIGDMDGDIEAAKNANLKKAIGVTWGFHTKERLINADIIIDSALDLLKVID